MKDSEIIEAKIGDSIFCELIMGQSPPGETYNKDKKGLPFYQGKADFGLVNPIPGVWCTNPKKIAEPNDILLSVRAPVGPTNIANEKCSIGRGLAIVRPTKKLDFEYLLFIMRKFEFDIASSGSGSTFDSIGKDELKKIVFPVPKLKSDQQRIASEIKEKLASVENMRRAALKQKEAVAALQGALLREVFPYKEGDKLPEGWKWEKIDNIAKVNKIRKKKTAGNPDEATSFVPMDSVDDVTGSITKTLFRPYKELGQSYTYFENGDIIFAKITPCMQNGKCAIVEGMKDSFGFGSSEYIVLTPVKEAYTKWVHYFLRSVEFRNAAEDHFTGSAGQQRVPTDFVQKYPIPVPDNDSLIISTCNKLDERHLEYFNLQKKSNQQLEAIKALPAAILREVFEFKS